MDNNMTNKNVVIRRSQFSLPADWVVMGWILFMHIGALAAFFTFSWKGVTLALILWWLTGGIGICLGYHRYFTHRSYATSKPVEYLLAIFGCLAGEAGPIGWVAAHRYHHTYSDQEGDPHSPLQGFFWSHMGWLFGRETFLTDFEKYKRYAPDMVRDKFLVFLDKYHMLPSLLLAFALYAMGGWNYVVWGMFVRSVLVYHSTWFVNSASHVWGYRSYQTSDGSRNNWWVALLTFGEGWHNNHHAFQRSARHGFRWWEVDVTYATIKLLWVFGLATDIHLPIKEDTRGVTVPVADLSDKPEVLRRTSVQR